MSHTPGPWAWGNVLDEVEPGAPDCCELVAYGPPDKKGSCSITDILYLGEVDRTIPSEANARLIAAAPDLLEALYEARGWFQLDGAGARVRQKIDAAIAKAEGK